MIAAPLQRIISHDFCVIPRHTHSSCPCPLLNSVKVSALMDNFSDFFGHTIWRPCKSEWSNINITLKTKGSNVSSVLVKSSMIGPIYHEALSDHIDAVIEVRNTIMVANICPVHVTIKTFSHLFLDGYIRIMEYNMHRLKERTKQYN